MYWNAIFLCVTHGHELSGFVLWCFNPVNTTHLFLREKIAPFGSGVMARLWIKTTGFDVCLWQSLNDSSGHLSNTQRHRMTIENLILDDKYIHVYCFQKTKQCQTPLSEMKMLASQYIETVRFFCM